MKCAIKWNVTRARTRISELELGPLFASPSRHLSRLSGSVERATRRPIIERRILFYFVAKVCSAEIGTSHPRRLSGSSRPWLLIHLEPTFPLSDVCRWANESLSNVSGRLAGDVFERMPLRGPNGEICAVRATNWLEPSAPIDCSLETYRIINFISLARAR